MDIDYAGVIRAEAGRIVAAYGRDSSARVPWSDRWTIGTVARHVAGTHWVVGDIARGRPTADFGLFATLKPPEKDAPDFSEWFADGTTHLLEELASAPGDDTCWTWCPSDQSVSFWRRRMAHETLIHRWDAQAALGGDVDPIDSTVAADGIDEYLDIFVSTSRAAAGAPAGPTIGIECTDVDAAWMLGLPEPGKSTLLRGRASADVTMRATATELLLFAWGRLAASESAEIVEGSFESADMWTTFIPPT
ncbi:maleylpyruvate isomerase family mycothiol-dependent enzyme [Mycobacterium sp. NPDC051804]|uniref:maleylpyruvate isomerase family mycothiol-dependent enzyme n=1 Tax=Mycobacterium sp. NPDC051804 TaxID=3364295 RepID=UPI0037AB1D32